MTKLIIISSRSRRRQEVIVHAKSKQIFNLRWHGTSQFLTSILEDEGLTVDADGKILDDGGLELLWPDGSLMLAFPQSVTIYTLSKLVDCVFRYVKWLSFSPRNRSVQFVPISIDLAMDHDKY